MSESITLSKVEFQKVVLLTLTKGLSSNEDEHVKISDEITSIFFAKTRADILESIFNRGETHVG